MSETTIFYNGVTLRQVRIVEYRIDSAADHGNPSSSMLMHTVTGEALVFAEPALEPSSAAVSNKNFTEKMILLLNRPRQALRIRIQDEQGKNYDIINTAPVQGNAPTRIQDEMGGPFFRASVVQITGTNALVVNFTVEFALSSNPSNNKIKSFYCRADFSIDEIGHTTIRKTGSLHIVSTPGAVAPVIAGTALDRAGSPNTATFQNPYPGGDAYRTDVVVDFITSSGIGGDGADFYRRFVSGNLYRGFRRVRQEYAVDESRTRLLFDITDQEFARGLPAPARVGDCTYTFERSLQDTHVIGVKHFIASVKGDRNVTPGALLTLCIRLSQNRIDYKNDLITSIRVTEQNMLTENAITFEVAAKATSTQVFTAGASDTDDDTPTPAGTSTLISSSLFLKNILGSIKTEVGNFDFVPAFQPDAYGSALIVRMTPSAYDHANIVNPNSPDMLLPTTFQLDGQNPVVYQFPRGTFDAFNQQQQSDQINNYIPASNTQVVTGPNKGDLAKKVVAAPQVLQSNGNRREVVHTGCIRVPSVSGSGGDVIFQLTPPYVEVVETQNSATMNEAPQRVIEERRSNTGSFLTSYSFGGSSGAPDLNGNRILTAKFDRTSIQTCPADVPSSSGASPSNPTFQRVTASMNGRSYSLIRYYPNKFDLPYDETQGIDPDSRPSYTGGLGAPEVLA